MQCEFCKTWMDDLNALQLHQVGSCPAIEHGDVDISFEDDSVDVTLKWIIDRVLEIPAVSFIGSNMKDSIELKKGLGLFKSDKVKICIGKYSGHLVIGEDILPLDGFEVTALSETVHLVGRSDQNMLSPEETPAETPLSEVLLVPIDVCADEDGNDEDERSVIIEDIYCGVESEVVVSTVLPQSSNNNAVNFKCPMMVINENSIVFASDEIDLIQPVQSEEPVKNKIVEEVKVDIENEELDVTDAIQVIEEYYSTLVTDSDKENNIQSVQTETPPIALKEVLTMYVTLYKEKVQLEHDLKAAGEIINNCNSDLAEYEEKVATMLEDNSYLRTENVKLKNQAKPLISSLDASSITESITGLMILQRILLTSVNL